MTGDADRFLRELRDYAKGGPAVSRAAAAWAVKIIGPLIETVQAWERGDEDEDEDDGT